MQYKHFILLWCVSGLAAQEPPKYFGGALGGFAILSGDGQTDFGNGAIASQYSSRQGAAVNAFAGRHWNDWLSAQANYIWNRNEVTLSGVNNSRTYTSLNQSNQQQFIFDGMVYFRPRTSRIRPYLSTGTGAVRVSREQTSLALTGPPPAPSVPLTSQTTWLPAIRVAVGIDLLLPSGWGFRYSFSETVTANRFSTALVPPGRKSLMNFHNLFGVVRYF
jgi:hypothetical protein